LEGYNIDKKLNDFLNIVNEQVKVQRHNHVLIAMGGDFTYSDAELWFNNLDKLILAGNKKVNIWFKNYFGWGKIFKMFYLYEQTKVKVR